MKCLDLTEWDLLVRAREQEEEGAAERGFSAAGAEVSAGAEDGDRAAVFVEAFGGGLEATVPRQGQGTTSALGEIGGKNTFTK